MNLDTISKRRKQKEPSRKQKDLSSLSSKVIGFCKISLERIHSNLVTRKASVLMKIIRECSSVCNHPLT